MKHILYSFILNLMIVSIAYPQQQPKGQKSNRADSSKTRSQKSVLPNSELTVLAGIPYGPVFVGGYFTDVDDNHIETHAYLWKIVNSSTVQELQSPIAMRYGFWLDEQTAWISAPGHGVFKTTDGGVSWVKQSYSSYGNVFFLEHTRGWYFGYNEFLMQVEGEKTNKLAYFENFPHYKKLQFVNTNIGWLSDVVNGQSRFQKSQDGGKTWKLVVAPFSEVDDFQFLSEYKGFVAAPVGLFATADGGDSWNLVLNGGKKEGIRQIFFLSPSVGWTFGSRICMTQNGGQDWRCNPRPKIFDCDGCDTVKGFVFTNENDGWILLGDKLFFTKDGGRVWKRKILPLETCVSKY